MTYDIKLLVLRELYNAFDELAAARHWACREGCAVCCGSSRVLMTTLEARNLAQGLIALGMEEALDAAARVEPDLAARPASSLNTLARHCIGHSQPPDDPGPRGATIPCPLLAGDRCPVYEHRPLACRSMVSTRVCQQGGEAVHDDWWVTLGAAFFQLVEAVDPGGFFGPMPAALNRVVSGGGEAWLTPCEPLPGLMAPAEHQARLGQVLSPVFARTVGGAPLGYRLDQFRNDPL